jgi:hypothetical protein
MISSALFDSVKRQSAAIVADCLAKNYAAGYGDSISPVLPNWIRVCSFFVSFGLNLMY